MATAASVQDIFPSHDSIFIGHIFSSRCDADESAAVHPSVVHGGGQEKEEGEARRWLHKDPPREGQFLLQRLTDQSKSRQSPAVSAGAVPRHAVL